MFRVVRQTLLIICTLQTLVQAQTFSSGSTGADGALVVGPAMTVPQGTQVNYPYQNHVMIPLREPPNHIYHFTTVTVATNYYVHFAPNRANTPVIILASGDVRLDGSLDVGPCCTGPSPGGSGECS